jgi:hypothetical protein
MIEGLPTALNYLRHVLWMQSIRMLEGSKFVEGIRGLRLDYRGCGWILDLTERVIISVSIGTCCRLQERPLEGWRHHQQMLFASLILLLLLVHWPWCIENACYIIIRLVDLTDILIIKTSLGKLIIFKLCNLLSHRDI